MTTHYKNVISLCIVSLILSLASCTEVELCSEDSHPHSAKFNLDFKWNEFEKEKPDSMYIFLSRLINTKHYVHSISTTTSGETKAEDESGTIKVEGGEYTIISCSKDTALFAITNKDLFATDPSMQINDLTLTVRDTIHPDVEGFNTDKWGDSNPFHKKLKTTGPIFCTVEGTQFSSNMSYRLSLVPKTITQQIKLRFSLEIDPKITINNIVGEISGIARSVKLTSGILDRSTTGRTYFRAKEVESNGKTKTYEGEINVLGLFPNTNSAAVYGPGILILRFFMQKAELSKTLSIPINLINTITNARLTVATENGKDETCNPDIKSATLTIGSILTISEDITGGEKPGEESPDGVDHWVTDGENGNIDMET